MEVGELLKRAAAYPSEVFNGWRRAVDEKRYGSEAEREAAYRRLRDSCDLLFSMYDDKIKTSTNDPDSRYLIFNWKDVGGVLLDKTDGTYTLHVNGLPKPYRDSPFLGEERRISKMSSVVIDDSGVQIREWELITQYTSIEISKAILPPRIRERDIRNGPLDAHTAENLAYELLSIYLVAQ